MLSRSLVSHDLSLGFMLLRGLIRYFGWLNTLGTYPSTYLLVCVYTLFYWGWAEAVLDSGKCLSYGKWGLIRSQTWRVWEGLKRDMLWVFSHGMIHLILMMTITRPTYLYITYAKQQVCVVRIIANNLTYNMIGHTAQHGSEIFKKWRWYLHEDISSCCIHPNRSNGNSVVLYILLPTLGISSQLDIFRGI